MNQIGSYRVQGLLGKGGMGRVYKVAHPVIGRIFALKRLEPAEPLERLVGRARLQSLFADEVMRMSGITHPNILAITDADLDACRPFYVMDYHCNNLGQEIGETDRVEHPSRPLPVERAVDYSLQILEGLTRLHHAGFAHRDIKPFNLLLTAEDQVKICDFGLSRRRGEKFKAPASLKVGSPFYAAPEQEENPDKADHRSDLYAAGVILYRMLSGRLPEYPIQPISQCHSDLDNLWDRFIMRVLDPIPDARYQRADAMRVDLAALLDHWESQLENTCRALPEPTALLAKSPGTAIAALRTAPIKTGPRTDPSRFGLDTLWRPHAYIPPHFQEDKEGRTVGDLSTGLTWQRGGSAFALDWHGARAYTDQLNRDAFAGRNNWRLPTIEELVTLLQPNPTGREHCLPPVFDRLPLRLWSCDRRTFSSAWYVNLDMGFVAWQDFSCHNAIKAVSSLIPAA